ncbi:MAG: sigma-54 dependent transcriptional regulator [Deltaproteobacteria bacterium]|nr:sigma-54 dependent transcriptional regulator [Deltaproteobacteria bacterium]
MPEGDHHNNILWTAERMSLPKALWDRIETLGYRVVIAEAGGGLVETIERTRPGMWVGQINGDRDSGLALLREVRSAFPAMPVILASARPTIEEATEAIRLGATEYLPENVDSDRLWAVLETTLSTPGARAPLEPRGSLPRRNTARRPPVAVHPEMIRIIDLAARIAPSRSTVLIQGESGTGKEVIARFIHESGHRSAGPFVAVNCAALPENLLESELFGHEKGAFTGAIGRKKGKFELANGGTLLLDEISEMAVSVQAKLLRVLQEREVDRVGGQTPVAVDVRVIATTNRDLEKDVREGAFRQDLFYRLNVVPLHLPPLRKRPDDITRLAEQFLHETASLNELPAKTLSPEAESRLRQMPWPGNVRELENLMERAVLLVDGDCVRPDDLDFLAGLGGSEDAAAREETGEKVLPLREMEKRMIYRALDDHQGNRTRASKVLGISVRTLRNKLNEYRKEAGDTTVACNEA